MYCGCAARPPDWLEDRYGIDLDTEVSETIGELEVQPLRADLRGEASTHLARAARALGYDWEPQIKFLRPARAKHFDCGAKCMLGCRCGAKWNAAEYVDEAVEAGANAAGQVGELIASHIIPRPAEGIIDAYLK